MSQFAADVEFKKLVGGRPDVDLVQLMLELAADVYPALDPLGCRVEIDRLAVACPDRNTVCDLRGVRQRLLAINRLLYEVEGFYGNRDAYYEPQNSYLNEVLARRRGIPISLGILYMAVAARTGLAMHGVNTPGHFIVGCSTLGERLFVDPFSGGEVMDLRACQSRMRQIVGPECELCDEHFRPATTVEIVARVLRNLKAAYAMHNQWHEALLVQQRLVSVLPQTHEERRDLGLIYLKLSRPQQALAMLEPYARRCADSEAQALRGSISAARRMIAEWN